MNLLDFSGKRVLVTGHTGFKGSWLSLWLDYLGANVIGCALEPESQEGIFNVANVRDKVEHHIVDIRNRPLIIKTFQDTQPEIVFHLAAQALVIDSYSSPAETFETNTQGTANILEAIRMTPSVKVAVIITTDKCYENREWIWPYRENDPMGGHDPYSASKGAAEIIINSYRRSFFSNGFPAIASARAGNVIGGGDWAKNRIIPDIIRSLALNETINVRNPKATRPWQHVLEPLGGYLLLALNLMEFPDKYAQAWNFGPLNNDTHCVEELVKDAIKKFGAGAWRDASDKTMLHEANLLALDISKARLQLGWTPLLNYETTIDLTISWYKDFLSGKAMQEITLQQIANYTQEWKSLIAH